MIWFFAFIVLRLAAAAVLLVTWGYAISAYSPFAFEMFIRPRLFPWLTTFVTWHHAWYAAAYLATVVTLLPDIIGRVARGDRGERTRRWAAAMYVVVFGAVGAYLVTSPYLPTLWNDSRSLVTALVSLVPLLWLAAVDHLAVWRTLTASGRTSSPVTGQRRLLVACTGAAVYVWGVHLVWALFRATTMDGVLPWLTATVWALALDLATFMVVYVMFSLATAAAASRRASRAWEHGLTVVLAAIGICELLRRIVLPALSFDSRDGVTVSVVAGVSLAAMWSGLALRRPSLSGDPDVTGMELLLVPHVRRVAPAIVALLVLPLVAFTGLARVERLDWDFVIQKVLIVCEWTLAFGLLLRVSARVQERPWSAWALFVPPLVALASLHTIPRATAALGIAMNDARLDPDVVLDRYAAADLSFRLTAGGLVEQTGLDADYYRSLLRSTAVADGPSDAPPSVDWSVPFGSPREPRPNVFVFVIDSLRRDYLSPYNSAVDFTPSLGQFARDGFVFDNAFTRYGGTWLAMPSIWVGGSVTRDWGAQGFERLNAIEKLVAGDGYRVVINDYTVAQFLRPSTPVTTLDPDVPSVETDLCHLLDSLDGHLDASASDSRPVFAYLAPMNVHILNTRSEGRTGETPRGEIFEGFYAPYASRVERMDACFGGFVSDLRRRGLYDNSVIVVTSDHGDSLGEGGNWGHQFFLFPEDVRVPLLVHVPAALRPAVTTDLGRVTFTTDLAPTLYALLGHQVRNLGSLFGMPLFGPADQEPAPRRRESFLLMSSYGATYGLLRRNGRLLYISDLINGREYAFDMSRELLGERIDVSDDLRIVNQRQIRERVAEVQAHYHSTP